MGHLAGLFMLLIQRTRRQSSIAGVVVWTMRKLRRERPYGGGHYGGGSYGGGLLIGPYGGRTAHGRTFRREGLLIGLLIGRTAHRTAHRKDCS